MRQTLSRLLAAPEHGTPRWWALTVAKVVLDWLMMAVAILIMARACGGFTQMEGNIDQYFKMSVGLFLIGRFTIGPAVALLQRLLAQPA